MASKPDIRLDLSDPNGTVNPQVNSPPPPFSPSASSATEPQKAKPGADGDTSGQGRFEFEQFEAEIPTFIETKQVSYQPQDKFIWGMRMNLYICFFVYMILANVILFCGRWNLKNERLVDQVLGLKVSEHKIEEMFLYNGLMLATAALLGVYAIMNNKYSIFLLYLLGLFCSFCFAISTFVYLNGAANRLDDVVDKHPVRIAELFDDKITGYNWLNLTDVRNREINTIQLTFNCCGSGNGYKDWDKTRPMNSSKISIGTFPWTCCRQQVTEILHANLDYCGYKEVEKQLSCPAAFKRHLVHIRNNLSAQTKIMLQVILMEALTVGLFAYKMFKGRKLVRYQPTPENMYSLSED